MSMCTSLLSYSSLLHDQGLVTNKNVIVVSSLSCFRHPPPTLSSLQIFFQMYDVCHNALQTNWIYKFRFMFRVDCKLCFIMLLVTKMVQVHMYNMYKLVYCTQTAFYLQMGLIRNFFLNAAILQQIQLFKSKFVKTRSFSEKYRKETLFITGNFRKLLQDLLKGYSGVHKARCYCKILK